MPSCLRTRHEPIQARLPLPWDVVFPGQAAQVCPELFFSLGLFIAQKRLAGVVDHICPKLLSLSLRSAMPLNLLAHFTHKTEFMISPARMNTHDSLHHYSTIRYSTKRHSLIQAVVGEFVCEEAVTILHVHCCATQTGSYDRSVQLMNRRSVDESTT